MCGFVGISNFKNRVDPKTFNSALDLIKHRGPDASRIWSNKKNIFLGHNRLSIIDISSNSDQPFTSANNDAIIVYNGEIYNYKSLKKQISFKHFKTNSDTEVILEGYLEQGTSFFKKLRGIYSFTILDRRNGTDKFILVRDPAGVKPLYYSLESSNLIFGSEIKALKPLLKNKLKINENSIKQFLNLGFIPEPETVYENIQALRPGYFLKYSSRNDTSIQPFFKYEYNQINNQSFDDNVEKVSILLKKAVKRNLVADVDISLSLSGGIDSSLVYYYAQKENPNILAQTIAFPNDPDYNESEISKIFTKHLSGNHRVSEISENIDLDLIDKIFLHFDQPYADSGAIPVYFINKYATNNGKVIIGGDGGDELFNGYPSQYLLSYFLPLSRMRLLWSILHKTKFLFPDNISRKISRTYNLIGDGNSYLEIMYHRNSWFPNSSSLNDEPAFLNQKNTEHIDNYLNIFKDEIPNHYQQKIVFEYFRKILLSDYLRKTDMMSMMNGVEWRVPLLDEDLTSFAFSIPFNQKSSFGQYKKHLRNLHSKKFPYSTSKKPKTGFQIPLDSYINDNNKLDIGSEILKKDNIVSHYFNRNYLKKLLAQFNNYDNHIEISRASIYQRVLMLYILHRWEDNN